MSGKEHNAHNLSPDHQRVWDAASPTGPRPNPDVNQAWSQLQTRMRLEPDRPAPMFPPLLVRFGMHAAVGAAFLVLLFLVWPLGRVTGKAQTSSLTLPDGSVVTLHAETALGWSRGGFFLGDRNIELKTGEALFKVEKGKRPFKVTTELGTVTVLGTAFDVYLREGSMRVNVMEGKVAVWARQSGQEVQLVRGQALAIVAGAGPRQIMPSPWQSAPGWQIGAIAADHTPLAEICREIERRFPTTIELARPELGSLTVSGMLRGDDPDTLVTALCTLLSLKFEKNGTHIIIL